MVIFVTSMAAQFTENVFNSGIDLLFYLNEFTSYRRGFPTYQPPTMLHVKIASTGITGRKVDDVCHLVQINVEHRIGVPAIWPLRAMDSVRRRRAAMP
jgi:hypothetical protein